MARSDRLHIHTSHDRVHRVATADGWPITLYEYEPNPMLPRASAYPVLLGHGSFCRYNFFDHGAGFGLSPWLAARGFHVFALDLRGRGESVARPHESEQLYRRRRHWEVEDFVRYDVPAAIETVIRQSGAPSLDYLGHSLGGIIAFAHLLRTGDSRVRRFIAAGTLSPVTGARLGLPKRQERGRMHLLDWMAPLSQLVPHFPVRPAARVAASLVPTPLLPLQPAFNARNTEPEVLRRFMANGTVSIPARKIQSLARWFDAERSEWHAHSFAHWRHPTLWMASKADALVPASWSRRDYEAALAASGSEDLEYIEFSRRNGHAADYGHGDMFLGRHVEREVFPVVARWFGRHG